MRNYFITFTESVMLNVSIVTNAIKMNIEYKWTYKQKIYR